MTICSLLLSELREEWRFVLLVEGKAPKTSRVYLDALQRLINIVGDLPLNRVTRQNLRFYFAHRQEQGLSAYTIHQDFRSLRTFFYWCKREGYLTSSPMEGIKPPRLPQNLPKALSPGQIEMLLRAVKGTTHPQRNETIVRLFLDTGLRLSELINLDVGDVDLEQSAIIVRKGKGSKDRHVPLGAKMRLWLHRYLRNRPEAEAEPLFVSRFGERFTRDGLRRLFRTLDARLPYHLHPHMLRHTFATEYLRAGGNLEYLRRILGHTGIETTQIYLHIVNGDLTEAHKSLSPGDRY